MTIVEALGAGLGAVSTWVGCARDVVRRLGDQLDPLMRLATRRSTEKPGAPRASEGSGAPAAGTQVRVEEAKYYLGQPAERPRPRAPGEPVVDRELGSLPRAYGLDRIVALPRDPWWLYVYWEITPTTRVQALRTLGADAQGAREVLRVYDVTFITFTGDNAWLSFDVELPPGAEAWYLNVSRPAASYCVEVGLRTPGGRFLPLARSNTVATPRSSPSADAAVEWVELRRHSTARESGGYPAVAMRAVDRPEVLAGAAPGSGSRSSDAHAPRPPAR